MKTIRVTASLDDDQAPALYTLLANSSAVEEAQVLDVNTTLEGVDNYLLAIDGDPAAFAERAGDMRGVESVEVSETGDGRAYALLVVRSLETPVYDSIQRASSRHGLVVRTPFVYRDGAIHGCVVGDPGPVQRAIDAASGAIDVRIDEIRTFRGASEDPTAGLSERQQEALGAAQALGYYDRPRAATHEDVADELGCAPQTASDHLQKAEAKLVDAALDEFGPDL